MNTRTGNFPIGFRRGGSGWQKDLSSLLTWAKDNSFGYIEILRDADGVGRQILDAGLRISAAELKVWQGLISPSKATRTKAIKDNTAYIEKCAALGPMNYFIVMLPEKPDLPRAENFGYMVESFTALAPAFEAAKARLVIEGWPGAGALCCTPEGYRAFFKAVPSKAMGVNYDPSHLIRMGIDPIRFLNEFASRVYHVHGKDTEWNAGNLYEFGFEQPPTFATPPAHSNGRMGWRYTIPGHGVARWTEIMRILVANKYKGVVSIELEDADFHGAPEAEKQGLLLSAQYLAGC